MKKTRKIIYCGVFLLIVGCLSFAIRQDKPTYHQILNPELVKLIADYIEKGRGSPFDKKTSYVKVKHLIDYPQDSGYIFLITYFLDEQLLGFTDCPLIICEPIHGKKIIFETNMYRHFVTNDYYSIGNYIEDKESILYRDFLNFVNEREQQKKLLGETGEELFIDYGTINLRLTTLVARFDKNGKLINASYFADEESKSGIILRK